MSTNYADDPIQVGCNAIKVATLWADHTQIYRDTRKGFGVGTERDDKYQRRD